MNLLPAAFLSVPLLLAATLQAREWTSADGRKMEADFVSTQDGMVTVRGASGKRVTFSLEKLSAADQAWVREKLAARPGAEPEKEADPDKVEANDHTRRITGKWERLEDAGLHYRLYGERRLKGSKRYPLVVYLHGRGGDVMTPDAPGQAAEFAESGGYRRRPCFIIAPQCPKDGFWHGGNNKSVARIIRTLVKDLPVDEDRIYITGYSMGGYGTFSLVAEEPELFAAAVPVAGGGNPSTADEMAKVPFWVFHGDADAVVKVEQSRAMVEALKRARANVKYTEIPGGDHGIGVQVYRDEKLHEWLFEQARGNHPE